LCGILLHPYRSLVQSLRSSCSQHPHSYMKVLHHEHRRWLYKLGGTFCIIQWLICIFLGYQREHRYYNMLFLRHESYQLFYKQMLEYYSLLIFFMQLICCMNLYMTCLNHCCSLILNLLALMLYITFYYLFDEDIENWILYENQAF
jgi:hypothetical protein